MNKIPAYLGAGVTATGTGMCHRFPKVKTAIAGHRQWLTTLRLRSSRTSTRYAR